MMQWGYEISISETGKRRHLYIEMTVVVCRGQGESLLGFCLDCRLSRELIGLLDADFRKAK